MLTEYEIKGINDALDINLKINCFLQQLHQTPLPQPPQPQQPLQQPQVRNSTNYFDQYKVSQKAYILSGAFLPSSGLSPSVSTFFPSLKINYFFTATTSKNFYK